MVDENVTVPKVVEAIYDDRGVLEWMGGDYANAWIVVLWKLKDGRAFDGLRVVSFEKYVENYNRKFPGCSYVCNVTGPRVAELVRETVPLAANLNDAIARGDHDGVSAGVEAFKDFQRRCREMMER